MAALYSNSISNGYVWDDHDQVANNPNLRAETPWIKLFSTDARAIAKSGSEGYYRPLQLAAYRIVRATIGLSPKALHTLSIMFAIAATVIALFVYLRLTSSLVVSFFAACLFALHPIHSEALDWISALAEIGFAVCVLLAFWAFVKAIPSWPSGREPQSVRRQRLSFFGLSLFLFAAGLLWKETAAILPLVIVAFLLLRPNAALKEPVRSSLFRTLPFWLILACYLGWRLHVLGSMGAQHRIWNLSPVQLALTDCYLLVCYAWKLLLPVHLNAYYSFSPVRSALDARAWAVLAVILFVGVVTVAWKRSRVAAFALVWVVLWLLPVMDIYALGRNVFAERYLFLSSFGFCLLLVLAGQYIVKSLPRRSSLVAVGASAAALIVTYSVQVVLRNSEWHDDRVLFESALANSPNAPFPHIMVASAEADGTSGTASAENHYLTAIELAEKETPPDYLDVSRAYEGLTASYSDREDYVDALRTIRSWRAITPSAPGLDSDEALLLLKMGRWTDAEPILQRASVARPGDVNVLNGLGLLAWQGKHDLDGAARYFSLALDRHTEPDAFQASLRNNLGCVYGEQGRSALAIEQFGKAVEIASQEPEYRMNLASALAQSGRYSEASLQVRGLLLSYPNYQPAKDLLRRIPDAAR